MSEPLHEEAHAPADRRLVDPRPPGRVLLVQRGRPPFEGRWGLPGGFCEWKETTEAVLRARDARRDGPAREGRRAPRRLLEARTATRAATTSRCSTAPRRVRAARPGGDDAADARWFTPREIAKLRFAFDHRRS